MYACGSSHFTIAKLFFFSPINPKTPQRRNSERGIIFLF